MKGSGEELPGERTEHRRRHKIAALHAQAGSDVDADYHQVGEQKVAGEYQPGNRSKVWSSWLRGFFRLGILGRRIPL